MNSGEFQYINVIPSNQPANGEISFRDGNPMINFVIGSQERYLVGSSVKLTGNIQFYTNANTTPPTNLDNADPVAIDPVLGVYSILEQLTLSSKRTNQTIEQIRDYNRFLASFRKAYSDNDTLETCDSLTACTSMTINQSRNLLTDKPTHSKPFCVNLPSGFLMSGRGGNVPLSDTWGVGGLLIQLNLAPESNVLFPYDGLALEGDEKGYYVITNCRLNATLQTPTQNDLQNAKSQSMMEYNSISSYYQVLNSSLATINFNLGLSNVLAVFTNFVKSADINSYSHGLATNGIQGDDSQNVNITRLEWLKNNMLYPNQFEIQDNNNLKFYDAQIIRQFLNSIDDYSNIKSQQIYNPQNLQKNYNNIAYGDFAGYAFGLGQRYDLLSEQGVDFSTEQIGIIVESDMTTATPNSVYLFVISRQTVEFGVNGIVVNK